MYDVRDNVVFVTGGANGLGKSYCQALLERGGKVFFGDLDTTSGELTQKQLSEQFGETNVRFATLDVTDAKKFEEAFQAAVLHFGHVDVMVNNAGILNEGVWELMIDINYTSTVRGTKLALEHMRKDKGGRGGRIVNISSLAGLMDHYSMPVYCGVKHAVRSFTSSIAMEPGFVAATGVSLACLCPDAAATDLMLKLDDTKLNDFDNIKEKLTPRMLEVSTVTSAFLQLLQLDDMNAAMLLTRKEGNSFMKMTMVPLGETFPPLENK